MNLIRARIAKTYNELPLVHDAQAMIESMDLRKAIRSLLDLIERYECHELVGVRLLHKHNDIATDELMIESGAMDADGFALITRAMKVIKSEAVPNCWQFDPRGFIPLEFSLPHLVVQSQFNPKTRPDFFRAFGAQLIELGASKVLGPALMPSDEVTRHRPDPGSLMLEMTASNQRANVLRYVRNRDDCSQQMIETYWAATRKVPPEKKKKSGKKDKSVTRGCTRICPYVQDPPVHQGTFIHTSS